MRVLIVGAGIGGPSLAYWLARFGHDVTVVEKASALRTGGYMVDFWGSGIEVAARMGILPRLMAEGYRFRELREVNARGRRVARLNASRLSSAAGGRYVTIGRSDLSRAVFEAAGDSVETVFGDTVSHLGDDGERVRVAFAHRAPQEFDLVVGADGLHSRVRELAFGPDAAYERPLGIAVAAFDLPDYAPRDELVAVTHTEVGAQVLRLARRDGSTMFYITFRHDGPAPLDDAAAQRALLRSRLAGFGWEVPQILERMPEARTFYLDVASQIRMPSWSRGRIALVGDAGAAPSLLAGQGAALAMVEAYVLACALEQERSDHVAAFARWEQTLGAVVRSKQDAAVGLGAAFAPRSRVQLLMRNGILALMRIPAVADRAMGRSLRDPIDLPPVPAA